MALIIREEKVLMLGYNYLKKVILKTLEFGGEELKSPLSKLCMLRIYA